MEAACGGRGGEAGQELTDTLSLTGPQFVLVELFRVETVWGPGKSGAPIKTGFMDLGVKLVSHKWWLTLSE